MIPVPRDRDQFQHNRIAVVKAEKRRLAELRVWVRMVSVRITEIKPGREAGGAPKRMGKEIHDFAWRD